MQDLLAYGSALSDRELVLGVQHDSFSCVRASLGVLQSVSGARVCESEDGLSMLAGSRPPCASASASECLSLGAGGMSP